jgi:hypothetical protein
MFGIWTPKSAMSSSSDRGPSWRFVLAALIVPLALTISACHGRNEVENRISPIHATLSLANPYAGSPDPAVYLDVGSTTGDLVVVNVKLRASAAPVAFDTLTLEFTYEFQKVQIGDVFEVNPDTLGSCNAGFVCDPVCLSNATQSNQGLTVDGNGLAHFVMGVSAKHGCPIAKTGRCRAIAMTSCSSNSDCPGGDTCGPNPPNQCKATQASCTQDADCTLTEACVNSECQSTESHCVSDADCITGESCITVPDTTLVTLGFTAATTFGADPLKDPPSPITLFTNPDPTKHGDCEILDNLVDIGIACEDPGATMTASR